MIVLTAGRGPSALCPPAHVQHLKPVEGQGIPRWIHFDGVFDLPDTLAEPGSGERGACCKTQVRGLCSMNSHRRIGYNDSELM